MGQLICREQEYRGQRQYGISIGGLLRQDFGVTVTQEQRR